MPVSEINYLWRRNRLRRYLSQCLAELSGSWYQSGSWLQPNRNRGTGKPLNRLKLDPIEIIKDFEYVAFEEEKYEALFRNHSTLNLFYEDISNEFASVSARIAEFLNISVRKLKTRSIKNKKVPLREAIANFDELKKAFTNTKWAQYFDE